MTYKCSRCGKRTEATINGECVECFSKNGGKIIERINSHIIDLAESQNHNMSKTDDNQEHQICKAWTEEADRFDQLESLCRKLIGAHKQIAESESITCPRCEGNGRLWADGKAHYQSEQRETVACGVCGGSGRLPPENAQEIAENILSEVRKAGTIITI